MNFKEFMIRYKWILFIIMLFQLWAIYRKTENWFLFGLALIIFAIGMIFNVYRNSGFFFKLCMVLSVITMLFQWYMFPGNFRTDSISVVYGGEEGTYGTKITDEKLIDEITDCLKEVRITTPFNNYAYDMIKGLLIEINGETYKLYGLYGDSEIFNNNCEIYLFNKYPITHHYLPSEYNDVLNELIRTDEPDIIIRPEASREEQEEMLNEMIEELELDCDRKHLAWCIY